MEWDFDTLKVYVDSQLQALHHLLEQHRTAQKEAIDRADTALEKRMDSMNEWRAQIKDRETTYFPRTELDSRAAANEAVHQATANRLQRMENRINMLEGEALGSAGAWGWMIAGAMLIVGIITAIVTVIAHH